MSVDITLSIHFPSLKFCIHIHNIVVEGIMSQISDIGPGSFFIKIFLKNI